MRTHLLPVALLLALPAFSQTLAPLTVDKIMRDPAQWLGTSPSEIQWSEDGKTLYFKWNPERRKADSLYAVSVSNPTPRQVEPAARRSLPAPGGTYNRGRTERVYTKDGDVYWLDARTGRTTQVTATVETESNPAFSHDETKILFTQGDNLFAWRKAGGGLAQLTDFRKGKKPGEKPTEGDKWLEADQRRWIETVRERGDKKRETEKQEKADKAGRPKTVYVDEKSVGTPALSPDERYVIYALSTAPKPKPTQVPFFVTESGYTEPQPVRAKVGSGHPAEELFVLDRPRDTVLAVPVTDLPGIYDKPDYLKDYPQKAATGKKDSTGGKPKPRALTFGSPEWSADGRYAVLWVRANDNKDRWLVLLDPAARTLKSLDRYRDEAWVGGPVYTAFGWLADNRTVWFGSEADGYAHLYAVDVVSGGRKALTQGNYEVSNVRLSKDLKTFYFLANPAHPGEKHVYRLPTAGGKPVQLTTGTGGYEFTLSPDEKHLALRYSTATRPWELYLMDNKPGAKPRQITRSTTAEFNAYPWREPEVVTFKARDGAAVYARLYRPANAQKNGAAVIFVHGAGYLQNAHKWWSQYFREYMFHNLLADKGYTVLDMDYRGSAGYGRDWRTGIYRHMGGKDLTDHIDGARWLVDTHGVDAKRIGMYGGSYGGFITLMALFTQPDVFKAGAALRSVTDWAHYNHPYTANILNEPTTDSLAYARSSPLYYAEGLKSHLLMCHGMVDVNVHFQDIVRLSQRLIELKKENWELAVYPVEDHAFVEPSSWTDEYRRILKLFDEQLTGNGAK
jgi:dipeptidyl aminopeptidase/acylaminoacyl peptidase